MRNDDIRYEDNRRPEEIESDIERTRAEVSSTIDAIQSKLTPGQLMDQAVAYARTSLPADFGANLGNAVRDNPLPVALIGVGLAWLMASGRNADGQARQRRAAARYAYDDYAETGAGVNLGQPEQEGAMQRAAGKLSETGRELKDKTGELGHQISDRASAVTGRAREMGHGARERLGGMGHGARERLGAISERSQQGYYRTRDNLSHMVEEQPLVLGALGLAVGSLLGALLPGTRREDEMMGEKRDELVGRAKETLREQASSAKETMQRAMDERARQQEQGKAGRPDGAAMQGGDTSSAPPPTVQTGEHAVGTPPVGNSIGSTIGNAEKSPYGPH